MIERVLTVVGVSSPRFGRLADWLPYMLTALAVVLAWQIVVGLLIVRAPPGVALTVAPGSALALRRAAESELAADELDDAGALAAEALIRAPFDARALRTYGLGLDRAGQVDQADEIITLAGNWSLRDDRAHAWLVERRLQQGRYASAFAHADTLARRREAQQPQVFKLYTTAVTLDPRALGVLVDLIATRPPWMSDYLSTLDATNEDGLIFANLAIGSQEANAPLSDDHLRALYSGWLRRQQIPGLREIRRRLGRPALDLLLPNASFERPDGPAPFDWMLPTQTGLSGLITADDVRTDQQALRVEYDGRSTGVAAQQFLLLPPGRYAFSVEEKVEQGTPELRWVLSCHETPSILVSLDSTPSSSGEWGVLEQTFTVPRSGCAGQWLRLVSVPGGRRAVSATWFDRLSLRRLS